MPVDFSTCEYELMKYYKETLSYLVSAAKDSIIKGKFDVFLDNVYQV